MNLSRNPFQIQRRAGRLLLQGGLDGRVETRNECRRALSEAQKSGQIDFVIDATATGVVADGVTIWIEALREFLISARLHYVDSQLANLVQFDPRHSEIRATFDPSYLTTDMPPAQNNPHDQPRHKVAFG